MYIFRLWLKNLLATEKAPRPLANCSKDQLPKLLCLNYLFRISSLNLPNVTVPLFSPAPALWWVGRLFSHFSPALF